MKNDGWKHISVVFAETAETQAEGLAISQAVVEGHCNECFALTDCSSSAEFQFPVFAWCMIRKRELLRKAVDKVGGE